MEEEVLDLTIADVEVGLIPEDYHQSLRIFTNRGDIDCRYYHAYSAKSGIVFVGDISGNFESPGKNVYDRIATDLTLRKISSLHLQYRQSDDIIESVLDTIAGVTFLQSIGLERIAIIGHSFGAVIAIQAAAVCDPVATVVAIAPEKMGSETAADLAPRCSLLLMHGTADTVCSATNSLDIHEIAKPPKQVVIYDGAKHDLDTVSEGVYKKLNTWLLKELLSQ